MAQAAIIDKCDFCDSENDVKYYCTNCKVFLSSKCKICHAKSKNTENDRIIPLAQARDDGIVHKSMTLFCSDHLSVKVTQFCLKCNELVCTQCLAEKHKKHNVTIPDKVKKSKAEELKNNIKSLKEQKANFENAFDIEKKVHIHFLESVDQVRKNITEQKTQFIEKLNSLCEEQFSELAILQQNEDKRYSDTCSKIQIQNQAVTMAIQTAETSITSTNTSIIIQATIDTTRTLQRIKKPSTPSTTIATFEKGDQTRPSILQVLGKINIKQTATVSHKPSRSSRRSVTKTQKTTDVQNVKLQEQGTSSDNKQSQRQDVIKPRIDIKKVRVKPIVKVKDKNYIYVIVPLQNKTAWVQADNDSYLTLINSRGKIIATSESLGYEIFDAKQYRSGLLVTCRQKCKIHSLSIDGKSKSTFSDLSPYFTSGLCVIQDRDVVACLYIPPRNNKVVRLNTSGDIIQTLQNDVTGAPLYYALYRVTSLTTGEVIVRDGNRIVGVDGEGKHLFTWKGEIQGTELDEYSVDCVTHDSNINLFVTDYDNDRVFVLGKDGSGAMCLLDKRQGINKPCSIAVYNAGQLWVGCRGGNIHIIEY